jgi:lysophospholipase L1-like esterase
VRLWSTLLVAVGVLGAVAVVGATASPVRSDSPPPLFDPPKLYYLALGDSVTYGFQWSKFAAGLPPSEFDTGYVDVFAARLRAIRPRLEVVNYACPGETTASFVVGPCLYNTLGLPLHDPFDGSQLAAALGFLRAHRGEVSPLTITLSGNDVNEFVASCQAEVLCIQSGAAAAIARIAVNLRAILGELRSVAPDAEIIVIGAWHTFLGFFAVADPLYEALNAALAGVGAGERAQFVDAFSLFDPQGDPAAETAAICTFTLACSEGDGHPSDVGYSALAGVVFDASGYGRLGG